MPISDLTDHTGYWLRMVSNAVSQDFARKVAAEDVTVAEWSFMRVLFDEDGTAPTLLASRMGMTRGAISKLADRLVAKRLVARAETGGRGQILSLTLEGRAKVPALAAMADLNDAEYFSVLSGDDREALSRILRTLVERRGLTETPLD
ncbi:MarR family winged helix-turn-helix transcriptional regulator [Gemmobacter serpentinus]|uniref:MarR family winged helix-turn-helix transcriptional regulator n=1 Tax=Gemmobacter serpentinus TaxID=2652247 RepID=UPI00124C1458|nr:MarR family transcriptional regulator [Gemmobacter serpentinus]